MSTNLLDDQALISDLRPSTNANLSQCMNADCGIDKNNGHYRNFIGLAELAGFRNEDIRNLRESGDPMKAFLETWPKIWATNPYTRSRVGPTIGELLRLLHRLGRTDVVQSLGHLFHADVKSAIDHYSYEEGEFSNILLERITQRPKYYHALLAYDDDCEDRTRVLRLGEHLERRAKLRFFIEHRDMPAGVPRYPALAYIIEKRCRKVVCCITKNFIRSPHCSFIVRFIQHMSPDGASQLIIPLILDNGVQLPSSLNFLVKRKLTSLTNDELPPDSELCPLIDVLQSTSPNSVQTTVPSSSRPRPVCLPRKPSDAKPEGIVSPISPTSSTLRRSQSEPRGCTLSTVAEEPCTSHPSIQVVYELTKEANISPDYTTSSAMRRSQSEPHGSTLNAVDLEPDTSHLTIQVVHKSTQEASGFPYNSTPAVMRCSQSEPRGSTLNAVAEEPDTSHPSIQVVHKSTQEASGSPYNTTPAVMRCSQSEPRGSTLNAVAEEPDTSHPSIQVVHKSTQEGSGSPYNTTPAVMRCSQSDQRGSTLNAVDLEPDTSHPSIQVVHKSTQEASGSPYNTTPAVMRCSQSEPRGSNLNTVAEKPDTSHPSIQVAHKSTQEASGSPYNTTPAVMRCSQSEPRGSNLNTVAEKPDTSHSSIQVVHKSTQEASGSPYNTTPAVMRRSQSEPRGSTLHTVAEEPDTSHSHNSSVPELTPVDTDEGTIGQRKVELNNQQINKLQDDNKTGSQKKKDTIKKRLLRYSCYHSRKDEN